MRWLIWGKPDEVGGAKNMFFRKKAEALQIPFDKRTQQAVIRCSICTGEQVAGFKDKQTGHFTEVCLIRNAKELEAFQQRYGIDDVIKEY